MQDKYRTIETIDNHFGPINALVLGFCDNVFRNTFTERAPNAAFARFFEILQEHPNLKSKDWSSFVQYLKNTQQEPVKLQEALTPVFVRLAAELTSVQNPQIKQPTVEEIQQLKDQFRRYIFQSLGIYFKNPRENFALDIITQSKLYEIFCKVFVEFLELKLDGEALWQIYKDSSNILTDQQKMIKTKFEGILEKHQKTLIDWFSTKGHSVIKSEKDQKGQWHYRNECQKLGAYFGIGISYVCKNEKVKNNLYSNHGLLSSQNLSAQQINILVERGIVDQTPKENHLVLLENTEQDVIQRLSAVKEANDVIKAWSECTADLTVPMSWFSRPHLFPLLSARGIIKKTTSYYVFNSDLTLPILEGKLSALPEFEQVFLLWKKAYYNQPMIVISNANALQWHYLHPKESSWNLNNFEFIKPEDIFWFDNESDGESPRLLIPRTPSSEKSDTPIPPQFRDLSFGLNVPQSPRSVTSSAQFSFLNSQAITISNPASTHGDRGFRNSLAVKANKPVATHYEEQGTSPTTILSTTFFGRSPVSPGSPLQVPPKKQKPAQQDPVKLDAIYILELLKKVLREDPTNPLLTELSDDFNLVCLTGNISDKLSCLLADPSTLNKISNYNSLKQPFEYFTNMYKCEILLKAKKSFSSRFQEHIFTLLNLKLNSEHPLIKFMRNFQSNNNSFKQQLELIRGFSSEDFKQIKADLENQNQFSSEIAKIQSTISSCRLVYKSITPQLCAKSIVSFYRKHHNSDLRIFGEIATQGLSTKTAEEVLQFEIHICGYDPIKSFQQLFFDELQALKTEAAATISTKRV